MVVDSEKQRIRFREEVWKLLSKKTRRGPSDNLRDEVEVIGAYLGLAEEEACREFLGLRGVLWDVRSGDPLASMVASAKGEAPPRNWFAFTDVYLL